MAILNPNEIFYTAFEPRLTNRFILYMDGIPSYLVKGMGAISLTQTAVALNHINVQRYVKSCGIGTLVICNSTRTKIRYTYWTMATNYS